MDHVNSVDKVTTGNLVGGPGYCNYSCPNTLSISENKYLIAVRTNRSFTVLMFLYFSEACRTSMTQLGQTIKWQTLTKIKDVSQHHR